MMDWDVDRGAVMTERAACMFCCVMPTCPKFYCSFDMTDRLGSAEQSQALPLVLPAIDDHEYRLLVLKNGLKALLVHDASADKAGVACDVSFAAARHLLPPLHPLPFRLQVRVGSLSDPDDVPGLAHFTEHMLFYSSEKYPDEDEYRCVGCRVCGCLTICAWYAGCVLFWVCVLKCMAALAARCASLSLPAFSHAASSYRSTADTPTRTPLQNPQTTTLTATGIIWSQRWTGLRSSS